MKLVSASDSALVVIDLQQNFMKVVPNAESVVARTEFLIRIANVLEIPTLFTEQNPGRMGGTDQRLSELMTGKAIPKLAFGCCGEERFVAEWRATGKNSVVLVGIETHICVTQTALAFVDMGVAVFLAVDAVAARHQDGHEIALRRLETNGVQLTHSESIAYEWLRSADHPRFREALEIVKAHPVP